MPLGTLDSPPPAIFRQGPSALSKLVFFSALAVLLMVSDLRFAVVKPLRAGLATALYPLQWALMQPLGWVQEGGSYLSTIRDSRNEEANAKFQLGLQSQRAQQVEQLLQENARLRDLLDLRERLKAPALAAQVLYEAADPYSRKIIIDKGAIAAVAAGAPVLDEFGVLGQVTRVYPMTSEVTLLNDRQQAIPVLDVRSGVRAIAMGNSDEASDGMVLRYMDASVDIQEGDLLTTSGIDGVYPPGLAVAKVSSVQRQGGSSFTQILARPVAQVGASLHVLVLQPVGAQLPPRPAPSAAPAAAKPLDGKGGKAKEKRP